MTNQFHKLLLSELHMVVCRSGDVAGVTDRLLCEAVTVNENLRSLGYTLKPVDLISLAASPDLVSFFIIVRRLVPEVKADPMYPGFPQQVMEISEAAFRMHQMLHYFSTYTMELFTGLEVSRGWLPDRGRSQRTQDDTVLLDAAVLELVTPEEAPLAALKVLLARRERMTNPELALAAEAIILCRGEELDVLQVRFKENLGLLFSRLMEHPDRAAALRILRSLCAHTGDVLRCTAEYLGQRKYHLRTSEKKLLVKLLEQYPVSNLRENLMRSAKAREQHLNILKHLDYNRYSRSPGHREAVRALRSGELLSWHGVAEQLLAQRSDEALSHLARRPGYMVRMLNRLLSLDYSREAVLDALLPRADAVSGHLALKTIRSLAGREERIGQAYREAVRECMLTARQERSACSPVSIAIERRIRENNIRADAQIRREPVSASYLDRTVRHLHRTADAKVAGPRADVERQRERIAQLRQTLLKLETSRRRGGYVVTRNAHSDFDPDILRLRFEPDRFRQEILQAESDLPVMEARLAEAQASAGEWLEQQLREVEQHRAAAAQRLEQINCREQELLEQAEREYDKRMASREAVLEQVNLREQTELARLDALHTQQQKMCIYDAASVSILKELLREHYRRAETPLRDKTVFCQLEQFDLRHSVLETDDRSRDGGYLRSGISYAIPADARFVRFFVYWDDPHRVDLDLHAGCIASEGEALHVGWNADFRNRGVLHSGDITHSDAAEYIDIDLSAPLREVSANIHLFSGKASFREIKTCCIGMMAVDSIGAEVKHYNPANCFFTHTLTQDCRNLFYGYVDVQNRFVRFIGKPNTRDWAARSQAESAEAMFSLQDYLDCVLEGQNVRGVDSPEEAEVVLTMGKSSLENGISLADHNFFLEC